MRQFFIALTILALAVSLPAAAQENVLADIKDLASFDIKMDGFVLDKEREISIHAIGSGDTPREVYTAAWILNKQTREVVWKLHDARQRRYSRGLAEYDDRVVLPGGEYEVYFSTFPEWSEKVQSFGDLLDFLGDRIFSRSRSRREYRDVSLTISGTGQRVGNEGIDQWHEQLRKSALVSLSSLWDNDYVRQGLTLERPMDLTIYALGEANEGGTYDYGWIIDTKTGRQVWQMTQWNSRHAGGAQKNRVVAETISLPAGTYAVCFVTDDSHSYKEWNAPPPYDPAFWGITIRVKDESMKRFVKMFDYEGVPEQNLIVDLTRLRDSEHQSKAFTLHKPTDVRVYALGEGRDGDMFDYGWIVDTKNRKKIWTMEYRETEHAGGDRKNRMVNTVLHLDKGSYIVYFVTDGSHSYRDWNSAPPYDPEHWGISLKAVSEGFTSKDVSAYEERQDKSVLARIVRVRDHERKQAPFSLSKKSDVHIYALGEGRNGDMFDYAWIEDARTGRVVWEMTYRMTEHAGGARKNRLFDGTISLPQGKYIVLYETDDSHSFRDWNEDPPDDPASWGVTVRLVREESP